MILLRRVLDDSFTRHAVDAHRSQAGERSLRQLRLRTRIQHKSGIPHVLTEI